MDGDLARLKEIVELKNRHGAWLMLDEAHATGVFGEAGAGVAQALGVSDQVEIQMGTLGKALGAAGGFIAGSRTLIDLLLNRARTFVFSTAPAPAVSASAKAGIQIARSDEGAEKRRTLWDRANEVVGHLHQWTSAAPGSAASPILPWIIGGEARALRIAAHLQAGGILAPAIRFPTVSRGRARIRFTVTAEHTRRDMDQLQAALAAAQKCHSTAA
jgi:7-keto-8-aminopelargonate synthetase-like enzyme